MPESKVDPAEHEGSTLEELLEGKPDALVGGEPAESPSVKDTEEKDDELAPQDPDPKPQDESGKDQEDEKDPGFTKHPRFKSLTKDNKSLRKENDDIRRNNDELNKRLDALEELGKRNSEKSSEPEEDEMKGWIKDYVNDDDATTSRFNSAINKRIENAVQTRIDKFESQRLEREDQGTKFRRHVNTEVKALREQDPSLVEDDLTNFMADLQEQGHNLTLKNGLPDMKIGYKLYKMDLSSKAKAEEKRKLASSPNDVGHMAPSEPQRKVFSSEDLRGFSF